MLKYLNMFNIIGGALILLSLIGLATGGRFLSEPGQAASQGTSALYLGAGILMLANGVISAKTPPPPAKKARVIGTEKF